ncbi:MAG: hypothetical protein AAF668_09570 [Pseudomonadota bacterium]
MLRAFIMITLSLGLYACVSAGGGGSAYTETGAICDNAGLESQMVAVRDRSTRARGALAVGTPSGGGAIGAAKNRNNVERIFQLRDRLNTFDAEVDVQYRDMTATCKAYARCMEMRRYREGECRSSSATWENSRRSFSNLTVELRRIEADVARLALVVGAAAAEDDDLEEEDTTYDVNRNNCNCSVGGVFSNCCPKN